MASKSTTKRAPRRDGDGAPDLTHRAALSVAETAKRYGCSRAWVYAHLAKSDEDERECESPRLRSTVIDGRRFIRVADAEAFFFGDGAPGGDAA